WTTTARLGRTSASGLCARDTRAGVAIFLCGIGRSVGGLGGGNFLAERADWLARESDTRQWLDCLGDCDFWRVATLPRDGWGLLNHQLAGFGTLSATPRSTRLAGANHQYD